ncbi:YihY/virulence factor BrkB family protein [Nonomuraea rhodomycinica]|uniref:YihY/virulence factor BrkB family protein n=1 Tax=Nonomuraea rhodomycinica TaxID=1712872 RepID=A0A7Y6IZ27_9ACTN|nr:YihY/virulence factor BrkB family protein [Nonomuraea rhodomycinica]NUW46523.1 YihY/virulence factor BrkB family protein [Nonomuraea rhodomycinica]
MSGKEEEAHRAQTGGEEQRERRAQVGVTEQQDRRGVPERPADFPRRAWWSVLKRTFIEFKDDNVQDLAAALTYYAVLSIFPAMIVLVSLFGLLGRDDTAVIVGHLAVLAPAEVRDLLQQGVAGVQRVGSASVFALVGLAVALWSASGYIAAFIRACNAIYDIEEGRPFWKTTPLRIGLTVLVTVLLAVGAIAVTLTGRLADVAGRALGVGDVVVTTWNIAKWPVLALIAAGLIMVLYWAAPNVRQPGVRWISPGGLLAVVLWVIVSAGFALYASHFGSYNKTYGTLAAVVVFLIWLWLSNMALLFGAELDAELMRERAIAEGRPADREPYAEPRDAPEPDNLPE